jgi:catechol-2,3-dioxygenase
VALRVSDFNEATQRWSIEFGLTVRELGAHRALLACAYEPYSLELRDAASDSGALASGGTRLGFDHTGYELASDVSLEDAAASLERNGVDFRHEDGAIHLRDPDGHGVELLPSARDDEPWPAVARSTTILPAFHPRKLGHVNSLTGKLQAMKNFYCDNLGMRVADRLGEEGVWLHINADHHTVALIDKGYPHLHHLAFEVTDWGELRVALDHLAQHGRWLAWGPLRHGVGQNLSAYVRIPEEECFVELFCDMEQLAADHKPRDWPDNPHSSNTWGILPPRSYFRFDAAAVQAEREGLEARGKPLPPPDQAGASKQPLEIGER